MISVLFLQKVGHGAVESRDIDTPAPTIRVRPCRETASVGLNFPTSSVSVRGKNDSRNCWRYLFFFFKWRKRRRCGREWIIQSLRRGMKTLSKCTWVFAFLKGGNLSYAENEMAQSPGNPLLNPSHSGFVLKRFVGRRKVIFLCSLGSKWPELLQMGDLDLSLQHLNLGYSRIHHQPPNIKYSNWDVPASAIQVGGNQKQQLKCCIYPHEEMSSWWWCCCCWYAQLPVSGTEGR